MILALFTYSLLLAEKFLLFEGAQFPNRPECYLVCVDTNEDQFNADHFQVMCPDLHHHVKTPHWCRFRNIEVFE